MTRTLLTRYPLLRLLSPTQIDDWIAAGQDFDCASGVTLSQENTPGAWIYLVVQGRVRILRELGPREITLGMLQAGDLFGEYCLLPPGRNTATCRSAAPAKLLRLPFAPLRTAIQAQKPVWKNLKNWLRLHTPLHFHRERAFLGFMSAESSLKLLDRLKPATFSAGQTIQANGLAADARFSIEQGTVRLSVDTESADAGEELRRGEAFGEHALTGSGDLPVAVAQTDVRCQVLSRPDFDPSAPVWSKVAQSYLPRVPARPAAHVWVPQLEPTDCGLAALAMVGLRCGISVTVEELRAKATPGPHGLSLQQLRQLALAIGLPCQAVRVSADRLRQVSLPALVHLRNGHYVVLHEVGEEGVVIGDPAAGIVSWHVNFFAQCYSQSLMLFDRMAG